MKISKYRITDIVLSFLLSITGLFGFIMIPTVERYNFFLIVYILLNICLFPTCFYLILNHKFPVCVFVPIVLFMALIHRFYWFKVENNLVGNLILICVGLSLLYSMVITIFVHSRKPMKKVGEYLILDKVLFRKKVLKRFSLYVRDAIVVFVIAIGIIFYSNVAFDSSDMVEFEVTVVDMNEREWKHRRTLYIEYSGNDSSIIVTSILVPNYIADNVSEGDSLLLKYREGFFHDSYFWIAEYE